MKNKKYLYTYRIADIVFSIFSKNEIRTTENFFPFIYQGEKRFYYSIGREGIYAF